MFPEYRDLISKLKNTDLRFAKLFDEHNELDIKINNLVKRVSSDDLEVIELKKKKLELKDQLYKILRKKSQE